MKDTVYLICGVSGSGKTWVAKQLADKFTYVPHDEHFKDFEQAIFKACKTSEKSIITECPFAERVVREKLEKLGLTVKPIFVVENPKTVRERFKAREGKEPFKATMTRALSIVNRAQEWKAPFGSSDVILKYLQDLA